MPAMGLKRTFADGPAERPLFIIEPNKQTGRFRPIFALAGVWRPTDQGKAYAFRTCEANPLVEAIHANAAAG